MKGMTEREVTERLQRIRQFYLDTIKDDTAVEAVDMAISTLKKQEADGWIPVSKYLPKKNGDYLVTCEVCGERYVEESFFCRCDDGDVFWTSQNVIAWQPRIEPYTAEEKGNDSK